MCAHFILSKTGTHFFKVTFIYISVAVYTYYAAKF